jgi:hypothetical protein
MSAMCLPGRATRVGMLTSAPRKRMADRERGRREGAMVVRSGICLMGRGDVMEEVGLGDSDWDKGVSG